MPKTCFFHKCKANSEKTCACQGLNDDFGGASYTFGCSWSEFQNGCKYGNGRQDRNINKFRLSTTADSEKESEKESEVAEAMHRLSDDISPLYAQVAPDSFANMTAFEPEANDCRIGYNRAGLPKGQPFSGVTAVSDFCAHAHKDENNMRGGCTAIVTLTKPENRKLDEKPHDEQLHVLPHYASDKTDEFGSREGHMKKLESGQLEELENFERTLISRPKLRNNFYGNRKKSDMSKVNNPPANSSSLQMVQSNMSTPNVTIVSQNFSTPDLPMVSKEAPNITVVESDCAEVFGERNMDVGGLAISLPHGSVMFECAKMELHATTALKQPNRLNPTRIGLVFYQHQKLHRRNHGFFNVQQKTDERNARDYNLWKEGKWLPTKAKLKEMKKYGYLFPENQETVPSRADMKKANVEKPDLSFLNKKNTLDFHE